MKSFTRFASLVAALSFSIATLGAQSPLAVADAAAFMGTWTLVVESPQGTLEQNLELKDRDGKVSGVITSMLAPDGQAIDDISKDGNDLVLKFEGSFQGASFPAVVRITPADAGKATVSFDVMNGQFVMAGTGTKR